MGVHLCSVDVQAAFSQSLFLAHELLLFSIIRSVENTRHSIDLVAGMIITNSIDLLNLKKTLFVISNKIK